MCIFKVLHIFLNSSNTNAIDHECNGVSVFLITFPSPQTRMRFRCSFSSLCSNNIIVGKEQKRQKRKERKLSGRMIANKSRCCCRRKSGAFSAGGHGFCTHNDHRSATHGLGASMTNFLSGQ